MVGSVITYVAMANIVAIEPVSYIDDRARFHCSLKCIHCSYDLSASGSTSPKPLIDIHFLYSFID